MSVLLGTPQADARVCRRFCTSISTERTKGHEVSIGGRFINILLHTYRSVGAHVALMAHLAAQITFYTLIFGLSALPESMADTIALLAGPELRSGSLILSSGTHIL